MPPLSSHVEATFTDRQDHERDRSTYRNRGMRADVVWLMGVTKLKRQVPENLFHTQRDRTFPSVCKHPDWKVSSTTRMRLAHLSHCLQYITAFNPAPKKLGPGSPPDTTTFHSRNSALIPLRLQVYCGVP